MRRRAKLIKSFPNQISNKCNLNGSIWGDMQLYQLYMWCTFIDLFKWTPTPTIPRAGLLTVLTYYVVLDTSTSPPKNLKIVTVSISMTLCRKLEPIVITSKSPSVSTSSYWMNPFPFDAVFYHCPARMRKGVKQSVVASLQLSKKSPLLEIQASERLVSTTNQSNSAKKLLQCASNRGIRSTSVTNSVLLLMLGIVATPIDRHPWPTQHASFMLMRTTSWPSTLVKIVEM